MTPSYGCPSCAAPLHGEPSCPACGLPLTGPLAARLWQVDQQLAAVDDQRARLTAEREQLLGRLRAGETTVPAAGPGLTVLPAPPGPAWTAAAAPHGPRPEARPRGVQNVLLTLGALLLALAGVVFTAVTYQHLGVVGRALVLLVLTGAAGWAPLPLRRRGLTASAEAVGAVAVALALLDVLALRRAGFAGGTDARAYWAVGLAVLAGLVAGYARLVPLEVARFSAALLAQAPVPLALARLEPSPPVAATVLAGQALADLLVATDLPLPRVARWVGWSSAVPLCVAALALSARAVHDGNHAAGAGLAAVAVVLAVASALAVDEVLQTLAAVPVVPLLGAAAVATARHHLTADQQPLAAVAVALLALPPATWVPQHRRTGPVLSALALSAITVLVELRVVVQAVLGPFTWLAHPWSRTATTAREALGWHLVWDGTVVTLVVLVAAAVATVVGALLLDRLEPAVPVAGVLLVVAAVTLPLGLATSYRDALLLLLVVALALAVAAGLLLPRLRPAGVALAVAAAATVVLDSVWSVADQDSTLTVLPMAAVLVAGLAALLPGVLTGLALLLGGAELGGVGAAQGLSGDQVGALVVVATAVAVAVSFLLRGQHRYGAEGAALVLGVASVALATEDPGWLSWVLILQGLLALAVSVRRDRREAGVLGGALLVSSSWVRLVDAHVTAPEPYVVPLAVLALVLGWLRRRSHPGLGSMQAYGGGLALGLVPSLLRSFVDHSPTRGLVLLVVSVGVVLVGARARLRAPLLVGGAVVVLDALHLVGPFATALPRWLLLGFLGLVLVLLGATYEQRLRDLQRLRDRYLALG